MLVHQRVYHVFWFAHKTSRQHRFAKQHRVAQCWPPHHTSDAPTRMMLGDEGCGSRVADVGFWFWGCHLSDWKVLMAARNHQIHHISHLSKIHGWILQLLEVQIQILGAQLGPAYLNDCIMEVGIKILLTPMSQWGAWISAWWLKGTLDANPSQLTFRTSWPQDA